MLSRLKVRTKLLAVLLPLLLGVGALAGLGVMDRLDAHREATRDLTKLRISRAASEVVHALQLEQLLAVSAQVGSPSVNPTLESQAVLTDQAIEQLQPLLSEFANEDVAVGNQTPAQVVADARRQLDNIADARAMVGPNGSVMSVVNNYTASFDGIVSMSSRLQLAANAGGTGSALHWLSEAKSTDARLAADVLDIIGATRSGALADETWAIEEASELASQSSNFTEVFTTDTDDFGRQTYTDVLQNPDYAASQAAFRSMASISPVTGLSQPVDAWVAQSVARLEVLHRAEIKLLNRQIAVAQVTVDELEREVRLFLAGTASALLLALLFALWVTRSITTNLRALTDAAHTISNVQLPKLVDSLKSPDADLGIRPTEIDVRSQDEFAELAVAFGAVEQAAINVAAEQAKTLRKGISDIFVNLARRNQSLLDRQIEFIDRLEANEEDPDQLENLFRLDHLATRMRRNAESLLVLAGAEGPRRRAKEVSVSDIVRVAVGEVEDFARITLLAVDEAMASGSAAVDVAHLLAELMENGTQYSPPDRGVEVVGMRSAEGSYVITLSDHGVGMSTEALAAANTQLGHAPIVGLSLSRSLGFIVVSTLAARHGITVRLTESPSGGITSVVTLPASLMAEQPEPSLLDSPAFTAEFEPEAQAEAAPADSWSFESFGNWSDPVADDAREAEPVAPSAFTPAPEPSQAMASAEAAPLTSSDPWGDLPDWGTPLTAESATAPSTTVPDETVPEETEAWTASAGFVEPDVAPLPPRHAPAPTPPVSGGAGDGQWWSAEVTTTGDPEPMPAGDHPMGAAFEQGMYALLDGPERAAVEPVDEAALATPPEFDDQMRRTSMWQARVDSIQTPDAIEMPAAASPPAPEPGSSIDSSIAAPMAPIFTSPSPTAPITHPVAPPIQPPAPTAPMSHPPASASPAPAAPSPADTLGLPRRVPGESVSGPSFGDLTPGADAPDLSLPRRSPTRRGAFDPTTAEGLIASSRRPAEEIRSILSSYRSGLSSGRSDSPDADSPSADVEGSEPTPAGVSESTQQRGHDEPTQH